MLPLPLLWLPSLLRLPSLLLWLLPILLLLPTLPLMAEPPLRLLVIRWALLRAFGLYVLMLRPPNICAPRVHAVWSGGQAARKRGRDHLVGTAVRAIGVICTFTIVFVVRP